MLYYGESLTSELRGQGLGFGVWGLGFGVGLVTFLCLLFFLEITTRSMGELGHSAYLTWCETVRQRVTMCYTMKDDSLLCHM